MATPIASVVIAVKNEAPYLEGCVESWKAQKSRLPFEVHFVDGGSSDRSYSRLRKLVAGEKNFFVWRDRRPGSPAARNYGAKKARGKVLLFTDADCRPGTQWVEKMASPLLEAHSFPLAAMSGNTEWGAEANSLFDRYLRQLTEFWERDRRREWPAFLPWAPSSNFAVKAEVFQALKGFDERWRTVADDMDFCWRLVLSGFVIGRSGAKLRTTRRHSLRSLLRLMENHAFYHECLLAAYQRELHLPRFSARAEKLFSQSRHLVTLVRSTNSLRQAGFRGLDSLVAIASLKGALEAKVARARPDPRLNFARRGEKPPGLPLSRGYAHLQKEGWCYWRFPADLSVEGDFRLYRPRYGERTKLSPESWKIWEVKSERGQSEDAAELLGQDPDDPESLKEIDRITIGLHTRRLLP
jgi:glycosyltransferase involved in cell wall biosynthesis